MKEILFRGFHECTSGLMDSPILINGVERKGLWVYGGAYVDYKYGGCPEGEYNIVCFNSYGLGFTDILKVIPETVGQYTGLTDKNGKKIFEGDVVLFGNAYKTSHYVYWQEETSSFILLPKDSVDNSKPLLESASKRIYEVIGNVHEEGIKYDN